MLMRQNKKRMRFVDISHFAYSCKAGDVLPVNYTDRQTYTNFARKYVNNDTSNAAVINAYGLVNSM